ncbi:hypothetical protein D3C75_892770 [compost metagenome]
MPQRHKGGSVVAGVKLTISLFRIRLPAGNRRDDIIVLQILQHRQRSYHLRCVDLRFPVSIGEIGILLRQKQGSLPGRTGVGGAHVFAGFFIHLDAGLLEIIPGYDTLVIHPGLFEDFCIVKGNRCPYMRG